MASIRLSKFKEYVLTGALVVVLIPSVSSRAQQDIASLLERTEELNVRGEYSTAIDLLRTALRSDPDNYQLLCAISDNITGQARHMPEDSRADKAAKEAIYEKALTFARHAAQVNEDHAEGWFQAGQALGRLALFRGGKTKVEMSKEVKQVFEKAIELDSRHAGALHGLARWHREVANLSWVLMTFAKILYGGLPPASNEEAVNLFKRALEVEPDHVNHHLELGKTYLEMKEKDLARQEFETVGRLPSVFFEDAQYKEEAEQLLRRLRR